MKSILWQLNKYQADLEANPSIGAGLKEPKSDTWSGTKVTPDSVAKMVLEPDHMHNYDDVIEGLKDIGSYEWSDILYPLEILVIYHLYYAHGKQVVGEERTDDFLKSFLMSQDMGEFRVKFEGAIDDTTKKITLSRVALATYASRCPVVDKLPVSPFRVPSLKYLGLGPNATAGDVSGLQSMLDRSANIEQLILGRMGYLMIWYSHQSTPAKPDSIPLLTQR